LNAAKTDGRALVDSGRYQEAIDVLEPLSKEASGDSQVFVLLGESYQGLNRNDDAVRAYESAIRLDYRDYHAHLKLANLLMRDGKTGRALTEYELAARFGQYEAVTRYDYGLALYQMGREAQALEEWMAAYQLEAGNPQYAAAVGIGLTKSRPDEAVSYFEKAEALGADDGAFYNNFGLALQSADDRRGAAKRFVRAVALEPGRESYRFNLAAAYMNMGAYAEAISQWDTLTAEFGPRWSYTVYRGRALVEQGRFAEAVESLEGIVAEYESGALADDDDRLDRTPPRLGEALEALAMGCRGEGETARALAFIRRAVELEPSNVSFLNNYGVILAESGNINGAKSQWKKVLSIDADNAAARKNLSATKP
jgi:Flp pilus assembly protein TadD